MLLAYYLTINRSQGQTLNVIGIELAARDFIHGHGYVGFSRESDPNHLYIYAVQDEFINIWNNLLEDGVTREECSLV